MNSALPVISCKHLKKTYSEGAQAVQVLRDVNMEITSADRIAMWGAQGQGRLLY